MSTCTCNLQRILQFIQAAVGISVIVLGVFNFINQNLLEFTSLVKNVYFIFFGLLLALSALISGASSLLKWFPFLKNWFGIGCFMVFVGCSCINGVWSSFTSIVGLVAVVAGFLMMIIQQVYYLFKITFPTSNTAALKITHIFVFLSFHYYLNQNCFSFAAGVRSDASATLL